MIEFENSNGEMEPSTAESLSKVINSWSDHCRSSSTCVQGYGLTETCGASFIALPRNGHSGTVGPPLASLELRFEGSEELGYDPLAEPPRGEILVRGPALFQGYYRDDAKTSESIGKTLPQLAAYKLISFSSAVHHQDQQTHSVHIVQICMATKTCMLPCCVVLVDCKAISVSRGDRHRSCNDVQR